MLKNTFQGLLDARVLPQESLSPSGNIFFSQKASKKFAS